MSKASKPQGNRLEWIGKIGKAMKPVVAALAVVAAILLKHRRLR